MTTSMTSIARLEIEREVNNFSIISLMILIRVVTEHFSHQSVLIDMIFS